MIDYLSYAILYIPMTVLWLPVSISQSLHLFQKIKNRTSIWSSNSTTGYMYKKIRSRSQKDICIFIFIETLSTIYKIWKKDVETRCENNPKKGSRTNESMTNICNI